MDVWQGMRRFYRPYRRTLYASALALAGVTAAGVARPFLVAALIDQVILGHRYGLLVPLSLGVVALSAVRGACNYACQYTGELFGQKVVFDLRNALYQTLQRLPFAFFDRESTGALMSRLTADVDAVRIFLADGATDLLDLFYMAGFGIVAMLRLSPRLTLAAVALSPCIYVTVRHFDRRARPAYATIRRTLADLSGVVQESLMGVRTVKSFAREPHEMEKFARRNDGYARDNVRAQDIQAAHVPLMRLVANLGTAVLLWYGGRLVLSGQVSLGSLVAFFSLLSYIVWPVQELGTAVNAGEQAAAAAARLVELLSTPRDIEDRAGVRPATALRGHVRFEHVSFAYGNGPPVLRDIELDAQPGRVIGLLGATGAGKSTLVSLIPRFYDVTAGRLTIDGRDVRDLPLDDLRRAVGVVPGDSFLFSASLRENIAFGRPEATPAEIEAAARCAALHDFIAGLPQGYDTVVGERGLGLSGGQRQRVALARALLAGPRVLILDDATSSVDTETEQIIQRNLRQALAGRTAFVVAHRLGSVRRADEIVVLDGGRIVERGGHDQLLRAGGRYRALYDLQLGEPDDAASPGAAAIHGRGAAPAGRGGEAAQRPAGWSPA